LAETLHIVYGGQLMRWEILEESTMISPSFVDQSSIESIEYTERLATAVSEAGKYGTIKKNDKRG
jgi:hypothetical protein